MFRRRVRAMFVEAGIERMTDNLCFGAAQGYQAKCAIQVRFAAGLSGEAAGWAASASAAFTRSG